MNYKTFLQCPPASLIKQLISMIYDSFLISAILFISTAFLLPFNRGEAIGGIYYSMYLLIIIYLFYAWFWNKSGQTLGMKVWKIRIINEYGLNPSWPGCFLRLALVSTPPALFIMLNRVFTFTVDNKIEAGLSLLIFFQAYAWRLFGPYTMHDYLSQTRIINIAGLTEDEKAS